jgi:aldose 1-epimerase
MSFSISRSFEDELSQWLLKDENTNTEVSIVPGCGALLHAFRVLLDGEDFNVIDNYKDLPELQKELATTFKGPKLSPFPCRIADSRYHFAGKEYSFDMALHGLVYNKPFTVTGEKADDHKAVLSLEYIYRKEDPGYPHDYRCEVIYTLEKDNRLTVRTLVANLGETEMPLADGWHPYFRLGGSVNDWVMQFHADTLLEFNGKLIPTGVLLPYSVFKTPRQIMDRQLDNCFVLEPGWSDPACEIVNPANGLRISLFPDSTYPYLQIYIPPGRQSIAIENLSGAPDCFNNKMGLLSLGAGHSQTFTVNYKVSVG